MPTCVECGEVPLPGNKRYCPECGIHFASALHVPGQDFTFGQCAACGDRVPSYIRICQSCVSTGTLPAHCPNCESDTGTTSGVAANNRNSCQCPNCSYRFDLPLGLAAVTSKASSNDNPSSALKQVDLEWLFFGAVNYQFSQHGGVGIIISLSEEGLELFDDGDGIESDEYSTINWPHPLDSAHEMDLIDLFQRYEKNPQLWVGDIEHEEDSFVDVSPGVTLEIPSLEVPSVRTALAMELGGSNFGGLSWLAPVVAEMLESKPYFR